jgi:thioester reductase-like protein
MNILITGGSGFIGSALLPMLVRDNSVDKITLLLRPSATHTANDRVESLIDKTFLPSERYLARSKIVAAAGDLTAEDLGLDEPTKTRLLRDCTHILHIGASTDFGAPIEESRLINVEGTKRLLAFAVTARVLGKLTRFDYVSTAFVAGTKPGRVTEDELIRNQAFANAYEQSKFEAEILVREHHKTLPTTIYRPSIVVGDSRNGYTPHFKVLYWPLQLLSRNILPFIPCSRAARLDIVPVDFVATSMYKGIMASESIGRTIYLTAGESQGVRIDDFLRDAFRQTGIQRRPLIPVWMFKALRTRWLRKLMSENFWRTCELASVYNDYLSGTNVTFDNRGSNYFLNSIGAKSAPHWRTYGQVIFDYCNQSKWGKRPQRPEFEYRNPPQRRITV